MITFLLNLGFDLMKKLVQVCDENCKWNVLFFDEFFFEGIVVLQEIGIDCLEDGAWRFGGLLEIVEIVRGGGIELFLKFEV